LPSSPHWSPTITVAGIRPLQVPAELGRQSKASPASGRERRAAFVLRQHQGTTQAADGRPPSPFGCDLVLPANDSTTDPPHERRPRRLRCSLVLLETRCRPESKDPGPLGPGPGCKSPAGRRRCCGDWSAGRSAASRDGRCVLIARSQDLPCPSRLDVTRERPEYSRADPGDAGRALGWDRMRRFPYCPRPLPARIPMLGSVQTEDMDRPAEPPPTGTAAVARRSSAYNKTIASRCPGRRSSFLMTTGDKSRRTRYRLEADHSWLLGS